MRSELLRREPEDGTFESARLVKKYRKVIAIGELVSFVFWLCLLLKVGITATNGKQREGKQQVSEMRHGPLLSNAGEYKARRTVVLTKGR